MRFLKNLFGCTLLKDEPFVSTPTQVVPGLEPIVVHAVEHLYPSIKEQKHAFDFLLKHTNENEVLDHLGLVRMGIKNLEKIMKENPFVYSPANVDILGTRQKHVHVPITKYQKRISGPLLDRINIHIEVRRVDYEKLSGDRLGETSETILERVQTASDIQN